MVTVLLSRMRSRTRRSTGSRAATAQRSSRDEWLEALAVPLPLRRQDGGTIRPHSCLRHLDIGRCTTCIAAKKLGRNYLGIELHAEYINFAEKRLSAVPTSVFAIATIAQCIFSAHGGAHL